jgi:fused signal recognition particle receptor
LRSGPVAGNQELDLRCAGTIFFQLEQIFSMISFFKKKQATEADPDEERSGIIERLKQGLGKTRAQIFGRLDRILIGKREITGEILEELEEVLFTSDVGASAAEEIISSVQEKVARKELRDPEALKQAIKIHIRAFLDVPARQRKEAAPGEPHVILVLGVNGVGKTTTIAKAAHRFINEGKKVMLVAADTFRAAAVEQLSLWAERVGADIVRQDTGADPSAVVFDALSAANSRGSEIVMIDTAGRLHTKKNLMDEIEKVNRIAGKKQPGAPHEVWLVLDATTGQNAVAQAQTFDKSIGVTGIVLTKLDGTAKGGVVIAIAHQMKIPILFIGVGEKADDLRPFDPDDFVEAIFD